MKTLAGHFTNAMDWDETANYIVTFKIHENSKKIYKRIYSYYDKWNAGQGKIHSGSKIFKMTVWPQRAFPPLKILIFAGEWGIGDKIGEIAKAGKKKYKIKRLGEPFKNNAYPDSTFQYAYFR